MDEPREQPGPMLVPAAGEPHPRPARHDALCEEPCIVPGAEDGDESAMSPFCPQFHAAVELVGRRWTGAILRALLSGATRFTDIASTVPGLSDRLLSERLRELEHAGVVIRTVYPEVPVRVEYKLTEKGRALRPALEALSTWADEWMAPEA